MLLRGDGVLLLQEFVDERRRPAAQGLRECTLVGYESALRRHILPFRRGLFVGL